MAITNSDSNGMLNLALDQLDEEQVIALEEVSQFYEQNGGAFSEEYRRMLAKHGPDHPRIKRLAYRLAAIPDTLASIRTQLHRARIQVPEIKEPNDWHIHGFLLDEQENFLPGFVVLLFNEKKEWVRELGYSQSDDKGHYSLVLAADLVKKYAGQPLFLTLADANWQPYFIAPEPVSFAEGTRFNCDLVKGKSPLATPPGGAGTPLAKPWIVQGRVVQKEDGLGIKNLKIMLADPTGVFTEQIKPATTAADGAFRFEFAPAQFEKLFQKKPSLFLQIFRGTSPQPIYMATKPAFPEAGKEDAIEVEV